MREPKQSGPVTDERLSQLIEDAVEFAEAGADTIIDIDEVAAIAKELLRLRKAQ